MQANEIALSTAKSVVPSDQGSRWSDPPLGLENKEPD